MYRRHWKLSLVRAPHCDLLGALWTLMGECGLVSCESGQHLGVSLFTMDPGAFTAADGPISRHLLPPDHAKEGI